MQSKGAKMKCFSLAGEKPARERAFSLFVHYDDLWIAMHGAVH
jgi:hypothetical protein